jgi:hypothetical protein
MFERPLSLIEYVVLVVIVFLVGYLIGGNS